MRLRLPVIRIIISVLVTLAVIVWAAIAFTRPSGRHRELIPRGKNETRDASDTAQVNVVPDTFDDPHDPALPLLESLAQLESYVFDVRLTTVRELTTITADYHGEITPGLTVMATGQLQVTTNDITDQITIPTDDQYAYTVYDYEAGQSYTYVHRDGQWWVDTQLLPGAGTYIYGQSWTTSQVPYWESDGVLAARDQDNGGTYHFFFDADRLTRVTYEDDDGHLEMEYLITNEQPSVPFPREITDQAQPLPQDAK